MLRGVLGTQTRKAAGSALEHRIDKPVPEEHTVPCDLIREVCIKHIIRAIFLFLGEGWGGVGRGYTEGVRMAEKAALIRWVLWECVHMCVFLLVCLGRQGAEGGTAFQGEGALSAHTCWICCPGSAWPYGVRGLAVGGRCNGKLAGARMQRYLMASKELNFIVELLLNPSKQGSDIIRF